jgi:hypothetical protein
VAAFQGWSELVDPLDEVFFLLADYQPFLLLNSFGVGDIGLGVVTLAQLWLCQIVSPLREVSLVRLHDIVDEFAALVHSK